MFALPGLTPLDSLVRPHFPGSSSLLPPANAESWPFASALCPSRPAAWSACSSTSVDASSSLPSPPWNWLPGNGDDDAGRSVAPAGTATTR